LSQNPAGAEVGFNGTDRAGGGANTAGKAALQVLAAWFRGHFVFKLIIKILNAEFFHYRHYLAFSGQHFPPLSPWVLRRAYDSSSATPPRSET
jgi:hypothetical protein